ncbi:MAG: putative Ig domain-containing protein [Thermoplasmatota archaeon]
MRIRKRNAEKTLYTTVILFLFIVPFLKCDISGGAFPPIYSLSSPLSDSTASFWGEGQGDRTGTTISGAGDVNGDGYDDFLIGTFQNDDGGVLAGKTYLILGGSSGWMMDSSLSDANASFIGEDVDDKSGFSVAGAGDVNGDGYDDIIIGAPGDEGGGLISGQTYMIFGREAGWSPDIDLSMANASYIGEELYDGSGSSVSGAGDVNGDGYDDFLIGSSQNDEFGSASGQTYLILGRSGGWSMDLDLSEANASFHGENADDYSGSDVAGAGDVNGDGYDDFLIGAWANNEGGHPYSGKTYLFLGKPSGWEMDTNLSKADASFVGENAWDRSGYCIAGAGDLNGDGFDDIIIGAYSNGEGGKNSGQTYVIFGRSSGWTRDMDLSEADASFIGEEADDQSGYSISGAGDVNDDGRDDLIIGARGSDRSGSEAGQTYLILGRARGWIMDLDLSFADASFTGEAAFDESGSTVSGAGDVNGDGKDEVIIGAPLSGPASSSEGQTYLLCIGQLETAHPPMITTSDVSICLEDELYKVEYHAFDIDTEDENLTWDMITNGRWLSLDPASRILEGSPENDDVGTYWVNISVSDDVGGSDWTNFSLEVRNVNDDPVIIGDNIETALEDEQYRTTYEGADIDPTNDSLQWSFATDASWLRFDNSSLVLSGIPKNEDVGSFFVNLTLKDGNGGSDRNNFTLWVENVNDAPIIIGDDLPSASEDEEYEVTYYKEDVDPSGDALTWNFATNAKWLAFNETSGDLYGIPGNDDVGSFFINLTLEDGNGGSDRRNFTLKVENVNDPPEILTEDITIILEDATYVVNYTAIDIDPTKDHLTWNSETNAKWLDFDDSTGCLSGLPGNEEVGSYTVNISVEDGNGGVDWTNFTLEVENLNDPPSIITSEVTETWVGEQYLVQYHGTDMDPTGDVLTWLLDTDADWLFMGPANGTLYGRSEHPGSFLVNIALEDGKGGSDLRSFILNVYAVEPERKWLRFMDDIEIGSGVPFTMATVLEGADLGQDVLFRVSSTPASSITIDDHTGELSWMEPVPGVYHVNITAHNGTYSEWDDLIITVNGSTSHGDPPQRQSEGIGFFAMIILGGAAAVVVSIFIAFLLIRSRRRRMEEE